MNSHFNPLHTMHDDLSYAIGISSRWLTLQIYTSALVFSPSRSLIRELFLDQVHKWLEFSPLVEERWGPHLLNT